MIKPRVRLNRQGNAAFVKVGEYQDVVIRFRDESDQEFCRAVRQTIELLPTHLPDSGRLRPDSKLRIQEPIRK